MSRPSDNEEKHEIGEDGPEYSATPLPTGHGAGDRWRSDLPPVGTGPFGDAVNGRMLTEQQRRAGGLGNYVAPVQPSLRDLAQRGKGLSRASRQQLADEEAKRPIPVPDVERRRKVLFGPTPQNNEPYVAPEKTKTMIYDKSKFLSREPPVVALNHGNESYKASHENKDWIIIWADDTNNLPMNYYFDKDPVKNEAKLWYGFTRDIEKAHPVAAPDQKWLKFIPPAVSPVARNVFHTTGLNKTALSADWFEALAVTQGFTTAEDMEKYAAIVMACISLPNSKLSDPIHVAQLIKHDNKLDAQRRACKAQQSYHRPETVFAMPAQPLDSPWHYAMDEVFVFAYITRHPITGHHLDANNTYECYCTVPISPGEMCAYPVGCQHAMHISCANNLLVQYEMAVDIHGYYGHRCPVCMVSLEAQAEAYWKDMKDDGDATKKKALDLTYIQMDHHYAMAVRELVSYRLKTDPAIKEVKEITALATSLARSARKNTQKSTNPIQDYAQTNKIDTRVVDSINVRMTLLDRRPVIDTDAFRMDEDGFTFSGQPNMSRLKQSQQAFAEVLEQFDKKGATDMRDPWPSRVPENTPRAPAIKANEERVDRKEREECDKDQSLERLVVSIDAIGSRKQDRQSKVPRVIDRVVMDALRRAMTTTANDTAEQALIFKLRQAFLLVRNSPTFTQWLDETGDKDVTLDAMSTFNIKPNIVPRVEIEEMPSDGDGDTAMVESRLLAPNKRTNRTNPAPLTQRKKIKIAEQNIVDDDVAMSSDETPEVETDRALAVVRPIGGARKPVDRVPAVQQNNDAVLERYRKLIAILDTDIANKLKSAESKMNERDVSDAAARLRATMNSKYARLRASEMFVHAKLQPPPGSETMDFVSLMNSFVQKLREADTVQISAFTKNKLAVLAALSSVETFNRSPAAIIDDITAAMRTKLELFRQLSEAKAQFDRELQEARAATKRALDAKATVQTQLTEVDTKRQSLDMQVSLLTTAAQRTKDYDQLKEKLRHSEQLIGQYQSNYTANAIVQAVEAQFTSLKQRFDSLDAEKQALKELFIKEQEKYNACVINLQTEKLNTEQANKKVQEMKQFETSLAAVKLQLTQEQEASALAKQKVTQLESELTNLRQAGSSATGPPTDEANVKKYRELTAEAIAAKDIAVSKLDALKLKVDETTNELKQAKEKAEQWDHWIKMIRGHSDMKRLLVGDNVNLDEVKAASFAILQTNIEQEVEAKKKLTETLKKAQNDMKEKIDLETHMRQLSENARKWRRELPPGWKQSMDGVLAKMPEGDSKRALQPPDDFADPKSMIDWMGQFYRSASVQLAILGNQVLAAPNEAQIAQRVANAYEERIRTQQERLHLLDAALHEAQTAASARPPPNTPSKPPSSHELDAAVPSHMHSIENTVTATRREVVLLRVLYWVWQWADSPMPPNTTPDKVNRLHTFMQTALLARTPRAIELNDAVTSVIDALYDHVRSELRKLNRIPYNLLRSMSEASELATDSLGMIIEMRYGNDSVIKHAVTMPREMKFNYSTAIARLIGPTNEYTIPVYSEHDAPLRSVQEMTTQALITPEIATQRSQTISTRVGITFNTENISYTHLQLFPACPFSTLVVIGGDKGAFERVSNVLKNVTSEWNLTVFCIGATMATVPINTQSIRYIACGSIPTATELIQASVYISRLVRISPFHRNQVQGIFSATESSNKTWTRRLLEHARETIKCCPGTIDPASSYVPASPFEVTILTQKGIPNYAQLTSSDSQ